MKENQEVYVASVDGRTIGVHHSINALLYDYGLVERKKLRIDVWTLDGIHHGTLKLEEENS
jgi:hypothetical protein